GAHVQVASDPGVPRRPEHVLGPVMVDPLEGDTSVRELSDDADEMDHGVAAGHPGLEGGGRRQNVAFDALDRLEAVQIGFRAASDEASHHVTFRPYGLDHGPPDEAGGARDEYPVHRSRIVSSPPRPDAKIAERGRWD